MYYYFWGMHWSWWAFWILLWMVFFSFMIPMRRTTYREMQSPLQLLKRIAAMDAPLPRWATMSFCGTAGSS